ncbi:MAG: glycosyltransferase [Myxococcaceae bacterium]|nr:glycosyltransferase [Myxococcaceae bacterium]
MNGAALVFLTASILGVLALVVQALAVMRARRTPVPRPTTAVGVSILKPLCGLDEALEANLEHFARMTGPTVELLLGVKDTDDAAFPLARRVAQRFPEHVRVVLQRGAPVQNPKVNQLITLAKAARFDLLMVSDSNAWIEAEALDEVRARFEDPLVACVANPVSGRGHESVGALMDNLHLAAGIGAGQLAAKLLGDVDLVVGKSMTLRREVLESMGGFAAFGDYAAEDFAIAQAVRHQGFRNVIASNPVWNVAVRRSVRSFFERYRRWAVLQRTGVSLPVSLAHGLVNPWPLALIGWALAPSADVVLVTVAVLGARLGLDFLTARLMRLSPVTPTTVLLVPMKDVLLFLAWVEALFRRTILWRGNRLEVEPGGKLVRPRVDGLAPEGAR